MKVSISLFLRALSFISMCAFVVAYAYGTTIVVLRTRGYVVLGADSLVAAMGSEHSHSLGCKVAPIRGGFVAAAGILGETTGFNAYAIANKVSLRGGTTKEIANGFERTAIGPFTKMTQALHDEDPSDFAKYCDKRDCLEVAFVSFDEGNALLSVRGFSVGLNGQNVTVKPIKQFDCPGDCADGNEQVILGEKEEATKLFDSTPHFWRIEGLLGGVNKLIHAEILSHGDEVAEPISVLILDDRGPRWAPGYRGLCRTVNSENVGLSVSE